MASGVGFREGPRPVLYCLETPEKVQPTQGAGSGGGWTLNQVMAGEPHGSKPCQITLHGCVTQDREQQGQMGFVGHTSSDWLRVRALRSS